MIMLMRNDKTSLVADSIVTGARWLFIVGIVIWLAGGTGIPGMVLFILMLETGLNLAWIVLMSVNRSGLIFRLVSLFSDLLFAHILFIQFLPISKGIGWVAVLPLITAWVYFRWLGLGISLILNILVQGAVAWFVYSVQDALILVGTYLLGYLAVGIVLTVFFRYFPASTYTQHPNNSRDLASKKDRERQRVIYKLISDLSATLNYQRVLETALDLSASALAELEAPTEHFVRAVLLFVQNDGEATELHVAAARNLSPTDLKLKLAGAAGILASVLDEGRAISSQDFHQDVELKRFIALGECKSIYCVPLRAGLDTYGLFLFAHRDAAFFSPDRCELLDIVGNQAVIALQNARLYQDLEQEKERMMSIQEESRKKLARDLHDGPTQSIAAIAMRVNFARRLMERDSKAALEELFKIEDLARHTTKEIRHMLFTLRPLVLESQGLVATLNSMAEKMKDTYGQNVVIDAQAGVVESLEQGKQAVVFYIAEEAVNNARKHAKAENIFVRLKMLRNNLVLLEIQDDGVGFDVNAVGTSYENRGSLGMVNMRERTELVNGIFHVESEAGRGTRIHVVIPLTDEAADRIRRGVTN
jgi:signal transduction histidine kinase